MNPRERMEMLARLANEYPWFKAQKATIVGKCQQRLGKSSEDLWYTMPAQCIPRSNTVNAKSGCPNCGVAIHRGYGYYPWGLSTEHPWKVQCPKCLERFPKNDFAAYYRSGVDQRGVFDHKRADQSLLRNEEHPDPKDPKHKFGVDAGTGYRDAKGTLYTFVAHYNGKSYWGQPWSTHSITTEALDFAYAYVLTGDKRHARKAAVILSRIAVLYPDMDYYYWNRNPEHNPSGKRIPGKILDRIWENFLVKRLLKTYDLVHDAVVDDQEFMEFLSQKTAHLPLAKGRHGNRFTDLIEDFYLKEVFRCAQNGFLWGNTGMTEENVALLAVVTRDDAFREQVVRWLFSARTITGYNTDEHRQLGGGLLDLALQLTRDGFSLESGGYCEILAQTLAPIYPAMSRLGGSDQNPVHQAVLALCQSRLSAFYRNHYSLICLGQFKPYWGDNGTFCAAAYPKGIDPALYFGGYLMFGDRQSARDVRSILLTDGKVDTDKLRVDDLYLIPPDIESKLVDFAKILPSPANDSVNLTGRGLVVLKQGSGGDERCLWTHYGNNHTCHNHPDTLSIGLFALGRDILPALGYPDLRKRAMHTNWNLSAINSNTVVVDGQERMRRIEIADQKLFAESKLVSLHAISADSLYEHVSTYRRCVGLVNVAEDAFYVIDFFDVNGGSEHVYSFHSGAGDITMDPEIQFMKQKTGTYAGPDVQYASEAYRYSEEYDWRWGNGFQYLYDVERSGPVEDGSFTWRLENTHGVSPFGDDVRCRLNLLSPAAEVAIAKGKPPQNRKGNPEYIRYVLAKRRAEADLTSQFVSVIETYVEGRRPVASVRRLKKLAGGAFASAVEVTLADGRRDLIVKGEDEFSEAAFEGGLNLKGLFCLLRLNAAGEVLEYHASMVREIRIDGQFQMNFIPSAKSRVVAFDRGVSATSTIALSSTIVLPDDALAPFWADITPTQAQADGSYRVLDTQTRKGRTTLRLDTDSFISGRKGKSVFGKASYAEAFEYTFADGATVVIPFSYHGKPRR